ncbi:cysteine desulfurase family protein [Bacillus sp. PS06]|uniref:cysteine desulfurase family protein n=1 Tax=Bacillus sp. PS06 TaxID=2764176 RepID=UPI00178566D8|nr:cysteine desulfurase family protein [Bacillus sp. PS06]MBD8069261.1 cysteine desulfurase [Bacillus sp. PS06]
MERIYMDHAATSPMHPEVIEKMIPYMAEMFGNPSSIHSFGRESRHVLDKARQTIANSIRAKEHEIIFTSGGTEADNTAIIGYALANREKGNHIITTTIEHHAVLHTCEYLEKQGFHVTYLPVDENGLITAEQVANSLTDETILVTIMFGNNEVGSIQPIHKIGSLLKEHQAVFHTDAVQAYGIIPINVEEHGIDLMSVSAHKINGPKGTGFLYVRLGLKLQPQAHGGEQERKRRAGTENVAGVVGLSHAVSIAKSTIEERTQEYTKYRSSFLAKLDNSGIVYHVNGDIDHTLPHILNISFPGTNVESMLVNLDLAGIAVSSGSACTAGSIEPSHVLVAMYGKDSERIQNSIRFSFGYGNTLTQVERAAEETASIVKRLTRQ